MSQSVGQVYKSRIPTLGDDASIQEALRVYHYGVDNYTTQTIPDDSIEGNFRSIGTRVSVIETTLSSAISSYVSRISNSSIPNVITAQNTTTVPLSIRAIASQTSNLQQWQDSSSTVVARISIGGSFSTSGYISVGSVSLSSSTAFSVNIINSSHKGIIIKPAVGQTANLQEWQNQSSQAISWVDSNGKFYSSGDQVQTINPFLLIGA